MPLGYHAETESLYIGVAAGISAECAEICDGVVLDYDSNGDLAGVDLDRVSALPQTLKIPERIAIPFPGPGGAGGGALPQRTGAAVYYLCFPRSVFQQ